MNFPVFQHNIWGLLNLFLLCDFLLTDLCGVQSTLRAHRVQLKVDLLNTPQLNPVATVSV